MMENGRGFVLPAMMGAVLVRCNGNCPLERLFSLFSLFSAGGGGGGSSLSLSGNGGFISAD